MDEDEEVVFKNTGLYDHLLSSGFNDFETIEKEKTLPHESISAQDATVHKKFQPVKFNNDELEEFEDLLNMFLNSKLIFSDDVLFIKNFISCFKCESPKKSLFRSQTFDLILNTAAVSTFSYLCSMCGLKMKPVVYIILHTIPIGLHCASYSYFKYYKHKRKTCSQTLLKNLKDLSLIIQKSIQFVHECEVVSFSDRLVLNKMIHLIPDTEEWKKLYYLRKSIFLAIRSTILHLKTIINRLIASFPLQKAVESLSHYLAFLDEAELYCNNSEDSTTVQYLQKMKYVYLLLQSEFLRRMSLCFIPSLWTCDSRVLIPIIFELLTNFNDECLNSYKILKSVFELYYTYERPECSESPSLKTDRKWIYREAYFKLSSLSFNIHSVLRESRCLEEYLENTRFEDPDYTTVIKLLDTKSEEIVENYKRCITVVNDFRKYVISLKPKEADPDVPSVPATKSGADVHKTDILLGVTDFSPNWPDEVYVGISDTKMNEIVTVDLDDDVSNPCSKLLINELKIALQDKAKEWKERERVALKNKNIDEETTDDSDDDEISTKCEEKDSNPFMNVEESKVRPIIDSETSFAQQIASASASWGLQTEEYCAEFDDSE